MLDKLLAIVMVKKEEVKDTLQKEQGALSLEWVALGLLVVVFISAIITFLQGSGGNNIAERIINQVGNIVERIGSGG